MLDYIMGKERETWFNLEQSAQLFFLFPGKWQFVVLLNWRHCWRGTHPPSPRCWNAWPGFVGVTYPGFGAENIAQNLCFLVHTPCITCMTCNWVRYYIFSLTYLVIYSKLIIFKQDISYLMQERIVNELNKSDHFFLLTLLL